MTIIELKEESNKKRKEENNSEHEEKNNTNWKGKQHQMWKKTSTMQKEAWKEARAWIEARTPNYYGFRAFLGVMWCLRLFSLQTAYTLNPKCNPPHNHIRARIWYPPYISNFHIFLPCLDIMWSDLIILRFEDKDITLDIKNFDIQFKKKGDILSGIQSRYPNFQDICPTLVSTLLFPY
jgi:hypothetical protein